MHIYFITTLEVSGRNIYSKCHGFATDKLSAEEVAVNLNVKNRYNTFLLIERLEEGVNQISEKIQYFKTDDDSVAWTKCSEPEIFKEITNLCGVGS